MNGDNINPIAISIIIAGAIFLTSSNSEDIVPNSQNRNSQNSGSSQNFDNFRIPDKNDHVRGNPKAKVTIVEFSDFECPFCARIHSTLSRIVEENNDVKWVYRHFPLSQIHSNALSASIASECVAKLAGNDAFWTFADALFNNQRSLGQELYEREAQKLGINLSDFQNCMNDKNIAQIVRDDLDEVTAIGGRGTPFSVAITASGEFIPFSGALPYENIVALIEEALEN